MGPAPQWLFATLPWWAGQPHAEQDKYHRDLSPGSRTRKTPGLRDAMCLTSQRLLLAKSLQANTCDAHRAPGEGIPC